MAVKERKSRRSKKDSQETGGREYNLKLIRFMREIAYNGEPYDTHDLNKINELFEGYLKKCEEWDMKLGTQAIALALGVKYSTFKGWQNDPEEVRRDPARARVVGEMCQFVAMYRESLMQDSKINPVVGIFWQKNYDGLKDQQETVVKAEEHVDTARLKDKYQAIASTESNVIDVNAIVKQAKTQVIDYKSKYESEKAIEEKD